MTNPALLFVSRCSRAARWFVADEGGQDVVEYALLAAFIGIAGYLALGAISGTVAAVYASWVDPAAGVPSLWDPPAPAGGGS
jgi:Flp pilus assembly pilin Flp